VQSGSDVEGSSNTVSSLGSSWLAAVRLVQIIAVPIALGIWAIVSDSFSLTLLFIVSVGAVAALILRFHRRLLIRSASLEQRTIHFLPLFGRRDVVELTDINTARWNRSWGAVVVSATDGRKYLVSTTGTKRTQRWLDDLESRSGRAIEVGRSMNWWFPS
jgi:hypothetical protein